MRSYPDIPYGAHSAQTLDIHLPECENFPVFIYFHGGGFESGDKGAHSMIFEHLCARGIAAVSCNYRMYPEAKYPDYLEDGAAAMSWVFKNLPRYGKVQGIYAGGSSAGGYLTMMLCFDKRWLAPHGLTAMDFAGFVHDAGQPTSHFSVVERRGMDSRRVIVDESAPLYHVGSESEYPPMLFIIADNDMECRYEQTMLMLATLKHFGHSEKIRLQLMHAEHCAYRGTFDENGINHFGKLVEDFVREFPCI